MNEKNCDIPSRHSSLIRHPELAWSQQPWKLSMLPKRSGRKDLPNITPDAASTRVLMKRKNILCHSTPSFKLFCPAYTLSAHSSPIFFFRLIRYTIHSPYIGCDCPSHPNPI